MINHQAITGQRIWHPCSQMKDYEQFKPLKIARAFGSEIELADGSKVIDAISSWWCKSLGHQHPRLKQALLQQMNAFEHVMLVNTTNDTITELSQQLTALMPHLSKAFYAGDGSCAVEIALKMSLHAQQLRGESQRTQFIALQHGYHGETSGALSVSDLGLYRDPYQAMLFDVHFVSPLPYVATTDDPLWHDCSLYWDAIASALAPYQDTAAAIILEPIVQGAGGMKIYSQDLLKRLFDWAKHHGVYFIADEIMTGIGRTGKMLACDYANIEPDIICLSKGLTAGWMPFSAVVTTESLYQLFYDDYATGKAFLHSHTYSGHVLGAAVALEVLKIVREENLCDYAEILGKYMYRHMCDIAEQTQQLKNVRQIGAIVAADLRCDNKQRMGYAVFQEAVARGALLRPLGNTIYWLPPINTSFEVIDRLAAITYSSITNASCGVKKLISD